jgi:hypothetical protein
VVYHYGIAFALSEPFRNDLVDSVESPRANLELFMDALVAYTAKDEKSVDLLSSEGVVVAMVDLDARLARADHALTSFATERELAGVFPVIRL